MIKVMQIELDVKADVAVLADKRTVNIVLTLKKSDWNKFLKAQGLPPLPRAKRGTK